MIRLLSATRLTASLAGVALVASGCAQTPPSTAVRPAGAIVLSLDDSHLYIADTDNNQVVVANPSNQAVESTIAVGSNPERIQVGLDGRLFVSNRQDRSVSVVDPAKGVEVTRIAVGTEPLGLSLSSDGTTLAVVNHTSNSISIIDTVTLAVTQTIATNPGYGPPIGVALISPAKMYVTHERRGESVPGASEPGVPITAPLSIFNPTTGEELSTSPVNLQLDPSQTAGSIREPGQPTDPIVSNGSLFIGQVHSLENLIPTPPDQQTNAYAGTMMPGSTVSIPVVANGIATVDIGSDTKLTGQGLEAFSGLASTPIPTTSFDAVPPVIMTNLNGMAMSGPSAIAIDPSGEYLYVTNMNSSDVSILATNGSLDQVPGSPGMPGMFLPTAPSSNGVIQIVQVGGGPKGIAIPASDDQAYVYNSFDETVSIIAPNQVGTLTEMTHFAISQSPLSSDLVTGRQLFFAADDSRMTDPSAGGIACASCHPSGRQDGRTWQFTEGPRNTPTLAGRHLIPTAPFHWDGALAGPADFNSIVVDRMGGSGANGANALTPTDFQDIFEYLDSLPAPDNPNLDKNGMPVNPGASHGQSIFMGTGTCGTCHVPSTDFQDGLFHVVGTQNPGESFPASGVNTPPLHGLFYSAPYVHDGRFATLLDRLNDDPSGQNLHGLTSTLSDSDKSDLVAYLNTL